MGTDRDKQDTGGDEKAKVDLDDYQDIDYYKPELNARAVRGLTLYFEHRFGKSALQEVFKQTGLDPSALDSEHNWVAMAYRDKLLHAMTEYAKDPRFAFYAGCYTTNPEVIGVAHAILANFSSPKHLYKKLLDLAPHYNRVGKFTILELTDVSLTCLYEPISNEYVDDEYGAAFRLGQLVAWPRLCRLPDADAEEKILEIDGRKVFHYVFRWQKPKRPLELLTGTAISTLAGLVAGLAAGLVADVLNIPPIQTLSGSALAYLRLGVLGFFGLMVGLVVGVVWLAVKELHTLQETVTKQQDGMYRVDHALLAKYNDLHDANKKIKELNASLAQKVEDLERANKELEEAKREVDAFNARLQEKVDEKTVELKQQAQELRIAYDQLQELDKAKTQFFEKINHELRTPLQLLDSATHTLLTDPEFHLPKPHQHLLETMRQNTRRLLKLINELLDLAKIDAGKVRLRYEETNLNELLSQIANDVRNVVTRHNLELVTNLVENPPTVWVDRDKMESCVLNLLYNAVKFTPRGGRIELSTHTTDTHFLIHVQDDGPGIDPDELPRIFDRFSDAGSEVARGHVGTGLGLSIVKEVVQLHNGRVEVESVLGMGTIFTVCLPVGRATIRPEIQERRRVAQPVPIERRRDDAQGVALNAAIADPHAINMADFESLKMEPMVEPAPHVPGGPTVLIVDDEPSVLYVLYVQLRRKYNVITATSRLEALAKARTHHPDLVISDVVMRDRDAGNLLCAELKSDPRTADIPVILMSARTEEGVMGQGFDVGADDYLTKPFAIHELHARTAHVIEKVQLLRKLKQANQELTEKNAQIERLATTDVLTQLYNRTYLSRRAPDLFEEARDQQNSLACLMLDIDHFKKFNTDYTHSGGDAVLRGMGKLLDEWFGSLGVVARYGGEEFVALIPSYDLEAATELANAFLEALRQTDFDLGNGVVKRITASIGVAAYPECAVEDWEALVQIADNALFDAKVTRNTVVAAEPDRRAASSDRKSNLPA